MSGEWALDEYRPYRPARALGRYVTRGADYRLTGDPGLHHGLPSGRMTLVVSLAGRLDVLSTPRGDRPGALTALLAGLHDAPAVMAHDGAQQGVQIDLPWQGARALFGMPAGELAGHVLDLGEVLGRRAEHLVEQLAVAPDGAARGAVLDRTFAALLDERRAASPPGVEEAWRRTVETGGRLPVEALARELGWSRRHLSERFRAETGLSPKRAARVLRFARACGMLRSADPPALSTVALECGYFDQAHFAREFRELAGFPATRWLAELPAVVREASASE